MHREKGFTLTELVVTLILITIIATFFSIRVPSTAAFSLDGIVSNLLGDIRFTQILSMSFNDKFQIKFNTNNYAILNPDGTPYSHPDTGTTAVSLPSGLSLSASTSTIKFNGRGMPLNSSNVPLTTITTLTITSGSATRSILINPQTGFANET